MSAAILQEAGLVEPPMESTTETEGSVEVGEHGEGLVPATATTTPPRDGVFDGEGEHQDQETVPGTPSYLELDLEFQDMVETEGADPVNEVPSQQSSFDRETPAIPKARVFQEKTQ